MIDLHLHTYYSDGTLSPEDLVLQAKNLGIDTIAITDHDGMQGLEEGMKAGKKYGVQVIPGIELSTEDDSGAYIHILGYGIDSKNKQLATEVDMIRQKRVERNKKLLNALNKIGCNITEEDLQLRSGQDYVGKPIFAMALVNKGYITNPKEAFVEGNFMRSEQVRKIHREKISTKRAIELIKGAGGISVIAHPMKIAFINKVRECEIFARIDDLLVKLKNLGLDGMECYYSKHLLHDTEQLVELAKKHCLIVTAGSDYHGPEFDDKLTIGTFQRDKNFNEIKIVNEINDSILCKKMV